MREKSFSKLLDGLRRPDLLRHACPIGNSWVHADDSQTLDVLNPATGELIGTVPRMGTGETYRAIASANAALPAWKAMTGHERAALLLRWAALMLEHKQDLALIMTTEQGKPLLEAAGEIGYAASFITWFAEEARRVDGEVLQGTRPGQRMFVLRQPVGVCAAITPWNFPAAMITRKAGPALAAGCTMVIKPAEATPFTALALVVLAHEAGIPPGVLSVVTGDPVKIGEALCASDVVRKLSFTGSTAIGRLLMAQCAPTVKKLSLELGGNAPLIVFDDADVDRAVEGILVSKFRNAGQTCVCANRIYVQTSIHDAIVRRLMERVGELKVGDGREAGVQIGPLIDERAVQKVQAHIEDALAHGGKLVAGGSVHPLGGTWFSPTVVTDVTASMRVAREETFGPLAPIFRFETEDEVVQQANDSEFGLAAYVFTESQRRIWRVSESLEVGMVGVNTGLISNEVAPFGGVKQSGLGREGSRHGIDEYLELKYLCLQD